MGILPIKSMMFLYVNLNLDLDLKNLTIHSIMNIEQHITSINPNNLDDSESTMSKICISTTTIDRIDNDNILNSKPSKL